MTGTVADIAVLPDGAKTMRFNYTLENNGAMPLNDIKLTEPELAGRTVVAADGTEYVVPEGDAVQRLAAAAPGGELPASH